jgi:hypothetical protein
VSERDIFTAAREMTDPVARAAYLDGACGGDPGLRSRIEVLLRAHDQPNSLLDHPAVAACDPAPDATQALTGTPEPGVAVSQTFGGANGSADDEALSFLSPPTRPDSLGRLGHYEVLQVLGRGGFGIVFRAFDEMLQRVVALKVMAPQLAATSPARKRFLREARSSAQVRHENVVQVYEVAEQPLPYLAMEFIPGETLQQRLDRVGPLDVPEVLRVGRQIAEGLAAAHATDLIHRDIKPGNVLLEGGQHKVKITDFGLARAADDASISQSGIIAGTPMYMAPEQALGQTLDQRADLFSLGSVLYQMATGRPPFRANGTLAVLKRVAEDTPRPIREIIPETPQWLCDIIAKLHAKNPDERYQSAREVADVLADCEAQLKVSARLKDFSRIPLDKPAARRRRRTSVMLVVLLLGLLGLGGIGLGAVVAVFWLFVPITGDGQPNGGLQPEVPDIVATPGAWPPDAVPPAAAQRPVVPYHGAKDKPSPTAIAPFTAADVQRIAALPAAQQIAKVREELMRRNLGFDGQLEYKIEDGVVVAFGIVTDKVTDIAPIRVFSALRVLDCSGTYTDEPNGLLEDLTPLQGMNLAGLTYLNLCNTKVGDAGLGIFNRCKNLRELNLWNTKITDVGLTNFEECKGLTTLNLADTKVGDMGLAHFKDCKRLEVLYLNNSKVTDMGLANFKDCKKLTKLQMGDTQITDAGLVHFQDCKALAHLYLHRTKVSDAGLTKFKSLPLPVLWIHSTGITDLTALQDMPLEDIRLTPKNITKGLDILRDMKSLKTIGVDWNQSWPAPEFWERYDKGEFKK